MTTSIKTVRAGVYARISSDRDGEALGVERQLTDCRKLCSERGWTIVAEYVDNNLSASAEGVTRPEYERLLEDIANRELDSVAVWDLDRLTRQPLQLEQFVRTCEQAGMTRLALIGGNVDIGTGDGLLVARIKGAVAAEESRKTGQRIRRKHQELAEKGLYHGGGARPFGFEPDGVTIREDEAALIREAAGRILKGGTLYGIRKDWTERGVPTVSGKPWSVQSIRRTLIRPRIAGLRQHQGEVLGEAVWPAILDKETWDAVCVVLTDPSRRQPPPSRKYPLRGVLVCGECGRALVAVPRRDRRIYGCRKDSGGCGHVAISAPRVETYVTTVIIALADVPGLREELSREAARDVDQVRVLVTQNAADEAKLAQLGDDYADGALPRDEWLRLTKRIRDRVEARSTQLASLRGQSALGRLNGRVHDGWDDMSTEDQRATILSLVRQIKVNRPARQGVTQSADSRLEFEWRWDTLNASLGGPPYGLNVEKLVANLRAGVADIEAVRQHPQSHPVEAWKAVATKVPTLIMTKREK
jgi:DNA invertase Pin-like site-specific DNA recombinase